MFGWLLNLLQSPAKLKACTKTSDLLGTELTQLRKQLAEVNDEGQKKLTTIADLEAKVKDLEAQTKPHPMELHYAKRHPEIQMDYLVHATDRNYQIDVRNFFQWHDHKLPLVTGSNYDEIALKALLWVIKNIDYVHDTDVYGFQEYWAFAWQTLVRKKGDCEDGAVLLANILMKAGVPYWRVRLNAGSVNGGGHCYVTYCRETDDKFVVLDWCYWPKKNPIAERLTHEEERNYSDKDSNFYIWFSWNAKACYGRMQTMKGFPRRLFKNARKA